MAALQRQKQEHRAEMSGVERLNLRVSSMINHPIAQLQRWVTIHRLDTDGDREWAEVMGVLADTDGLDISVDEEGASVTLRWQPSEVEERPLEADDALPTEQPAPF